MQRRPRSTWSRCIRADNKVKRDTYILFYVSMTFQQEQYFCERSFIRQAIPVNTKKRITFAQRRPNVFDVGPIVYKCYTILVCFVFQVKVNGSSDSFILKSFFCMKYAELPCLLPIVSLDLKGVICHSLAWHLLAAGDETD